MSSSGKRPDLFCLWLQKCKNEKSCVKRVGLSAVRDPSKTKLAGVGEDVTIKTREIRKGFIYEINILERKWTSCLRKKRI